MSLIVDALQKAGKTSSTPSPAISPPRSRFLWFYRGLLIGTVMLILVIVANGQFRHLFVPSSAPPATPPAEVPFYSSSLLPFPTPSTIPSPTPSIQPPPAPAPPLQ